MVRAPTLAAIQRKLRESVCSRCANARSRRNRSPAGLQASRLCEARCPLFRQLPRLKRAVELLDPVLRSRGEEQEHVIKQMSLEDRQVPLGRPRRSALERYRRRIAAAIDSLYRW
jgi:hypothetical protein